MPTPTSPCSSKSQAQAATTTAVPPNACFVCLHVECDGYPKAKLEKFCKCHYSHEPCLRDWLSKAPQDDRCEVCLHEYRYEPKHEPHPKWFVAVHVLGMVGVYVGLGLMLMGYAVMSCADAKPEHWCKTAVIADLMNNFGALVFGVSYVHHVYVTLGVTGVLGVAAGIGAIIGIIVLNPTMYIAIGGVLLICLVFACAMMPGIQKPEVDTYFKRMFKALMPFVYMAGVAAYAIVGFIHTYLIPNSTIVVRQSCCLRRSQMRLVPFKEQV